MPGNQQGQLFFLDFLISVAVVFLAVGLLMQQTELYSYNAKQYQNQLELEKIGENAMQALTHDANIACTLVVNDGLVQNEGDDDPVIGTLPYCLTLVYKGNIPHGDPGDWAPAWGLRRKKQGNIVAKDLMGIPKNYECQLSLSPELPEQTTNKKLFVTQCCTTGSDSIKDWNSVHSADPVCNSWVNAANIFVQTRRVVFFESTESQNEGDSTVNKGQLDACMGNTNRATYDASDHELDLSTETCNGAGANNTINLHDANITLKVWKIP